MPRHRLASLVVCLLALALSPAVVSARPSAANCSGGRFIATVADIQRQNWIEKNPTVYDQKQSMLRLPGWLGAIKLVHASQGFLLSGEERVGQWTVVTVPPTLTLSGSLFGKHIYTGLVLPVLRETRACRDLDGNLYVR
jgi:hypothetical protein